MVTDLNQCMYIMRLLCTSYYTSNIKNICMHCSFCRNIYGLKPPQNLSILSLEDNVLVFYDSPHICRYGFKIKIYNWPVG